MVIYYTYIGNSQSKTSEQANTSNDSHSRDQEPGDRFLLYPNKAQKKVITRLHCTIGYPTAISEFVIKVITAMTLR